MRQKSLWRVYYCAYYVSTAITLLCRSGNICSNERIAAGAEGGRSILTNVVSFRHTRVPQLPLSPTIDYQDLIVAAFAFMRLEHVHPLTCWHITHWVRKLGHSNAYTVSTASLETFDAPSANIACFEGTIPRRSRYSGVPAWLGITQGVWQASGNQMSQSFKRW